MLKITAEPMPSQPRICRFVADQPLCEDSVNCASAELAKGSPLLEALFAVKGVRQVMVEKNVVTVERAEAGDWSDAAKRIGAAIRSQVESGKALFAPDGARRKQVEEHIRRETEKVLREKVNPSLAGHGGGAEVAGVEGTEVRVRLRGGCQGCASARMTLRQGIEQAIFDAVPEVTDVVDVTDHAAGANPFFKGTPGASPFAS